MRDFILQEISRMRNELRSEISKLYMMYRYSQKWAIEDQKRKIKDIQSALQGANTMLDNYCAKH